MTEPEDPARASPEFSDSGASDSGPGDPRGAVELLLGALAGSALLPFVQAMATKAGEDVYGKIRDRLSRRHRKQAKAALETKGSVIIADDETRLVLQLPSTTTESMAARLGTVRVPATRDGWLLVRWDPMAGEWQTHRCDPPTTDYTIKVGEDQK
ncbi:hypothetical protein [Kribbella italica]|uniref:Uncharacterized protein n=1 Tax=Kribbella italica TaxID=1540520 RepID=A0A7W9JGA0_9ACTN|nr:hypothetical protein [Kribbella italica]MBB5840943.1 hypothetical protein [Kribbella italica]